MTRKEAVEQLIKRHELKAQQYMMMGAYHQEQVNNLKAYRYELDKPGFKTKGWTRYSGQSRVETYVIQAGDTHRGIE